MSLAQVLRGGGTPSQHGASSRDRPRGPGRYRHPGSDRLLRVGGACLLAVVTGGIPGGVHGSAGHAGAPEATQQVTGTKVEVSRHAPLATLDAYLAAFEANYRPPDHELAALYVAEAAFAGARRGLVPRLTLGQDLDWDAFSAVSLELEAGIEVPLISSTAAAENELAELDMTVRRQAQILSHKEARANLLIDLAHLSTITWAQQIVAEAVRRVEHVDLRWPAETNRGYVPPHERESFDLVQRLFDTELWLAQQSEGSFRRLARTLDLPVARLAPPQLADLERFLDSASSNRTLSNTDLHPPADSACFEASPLVAAARLRHDQSVAHDALLELPDYSLGLNARVDYAFPPWPPGGSVGRNGVTEPGSADFDAAIALEARYVVPEGWPLGGALTVGVRPGGLEQSLDLAWPPLPRPRQVVNDRGRELAWELESVAADLEGLRRARLLARDDRERLERQLKWLVVDVVPDIDEATLLRVVALASSSPAVSILQESSADAASVPTAVDLELAELRLQIGFAHLAEMTAQVEYLAACGSL